MFLSTGKIILILLPKAGVKKFSSLLRDVLYEIWIFFKYRAVDLHKILAYLVGRRPAQILALNRGYSRAVDLSPYLKVFTVV